MFYCTSFIVLMWLLKESSDKWRNFITFYSRFSCWRSQVRDKKEGKENRNIPLKVQFCLDCWCCFLILCNTNTLICANLHALNFSLEMYLFFCLKSGGLGGYFSWWSWVWSIKWFMQENICFLREAHVDIQVVRLMSVRRIPHSVIFFLGIEMLSLLFAFDTFPQFYRAIP